MFFDRGVADVPYANYSFVLAFLASLPSIVSLFNKKIEFPIIIGIVFAILCMLSLFWSPDTTFSTTRTITVFLMQLIFIMIASYQDNSLKAVKVFLVSLFLGASLLLILSSTSLSAFSSPSIRTSGRQTTDLMSDDNLLGKLLAIGSTICLFFYLKRRRLLYLIVFLAYSVVLVTLKSKGALLSFLAGSLVLLFVYFYKRNKIGRFGWIVAISCILFINILNSGFFGDAFIRVTNMFGFLSNDANVIDYSTELRMYYITYGIECFLQSPIFGHGIGSSDFILRGSYFHNNYIQLLVETGIVGFVIYYSVYVWFLKRLWKYRTYNECMLCLALVVIFILSDISNTTYYSKLNYIILGISYLSICNAKRNVKSLCHEKEL